MNAIRLTVAALLAASAFAQQPRDAAPPPMRPIDFAAVDRTMGKLPPLHAVKPLYGLFLFGPNGEHRVWAVFDRSARGAAHYDVLYVDLDADGDLTEEGERFTGKVSRSGRDKERVLVKFAIGDLRDPGSQAVHTKFVVTWTPESARYQMLWRGDKITMGAFGPFSKTYQHFSASPETAPIFVPGYDRPFEFEHWMCNTLKRGVAKDFKVFVGNRGDRTGTFSCVDDKFLPEQEYVQATLIYRDANDEQQQLLVKLTRRC